MTRAFRKYAAGVLLSLAGLTAFGQSTPPSVEARFTPDSIAIGDQFTLEVTVSKDIVQQVGFPEFEDHKIGKIIEILQESGADTVSREGRNVVLRKKYLLTTFDEGAYSLGRYPVLYADKNITDTIWSKDSLLLKVGTFEIDTTKDRIFDIKPPLEMPLKFGEFSGYLLWGLLGLAALGVLVWLFIKRRKALGLFGAPKSIDPPHVAAIKALETLHNQKVWQTGRHKLYYTKLTDIIREYLEKRYGIPAMEMTSDEILSAIIDLNLPVKSVDEMQDLLRSADLVKFAKYVPDADYNENAYLSAYYFVEDTKPRDPEVEQAAEAEHEK